MKYIVLLGRILFSLIFLKSITFHFSAKAIAYGTSKGLPLAEFFVPAAGVLAFLGGLSIVLGYKAKIGGWMIVAFLIPVTLMMHDYWNVTDPMMHGTQMTMFMKNISMLGGAFLIAYFGAGPMSIDSKISSDKFTRS